MKDSIKLTIPSKAEYISVVRLTASSIANNIGMSIDTLEDIKVSIAEACINAFKLSKEEEIEIEFEVKDSSIYIRVKDVEDVTNSDEDELQQLNMGLLIINSLMDEVKFDDFGIQMMKFIGVDSQ